jgi:hypothetical protein
MTVPIPPILIVLGLVGNILSFLLMSQKKYKKSTTCFYMRCMAIFDSIYIFGRMFLRYLLVMAPQLFRNREVKKAYCLFYFVALVMGMVLSPLILVVMSFDRFLALTWPLKAATICTIRRARITASVIFLFGICIGLVNLARNFQEKFKYWLCPYHFNEPWDNIFEVNFAVFAAYIPIIFLVFFNTGVLLAVYRSKRNKELNRTSSCSNDSSITLATILVTSAFIGLQMTGKVDSVFWSVFKGEVTKDVQQLQRLFLNISVLFEYTNYCLNSFLYTLACKRLRRELINTMLPTRCWKH